MQAKFLHAVADRLRIADIAVCEAAQPIIDSQAGFSITQPIKPIAELLRLDDLDLSFMKDICGFVKVFGRWKSIGKDSVALNRSSIQFNQHSAHQF